jgi:hypothetical protein
VGNIWTEITGGVMRNGKETVQVTCYTHELNIFPRMYYFTRKYTSKYKVLYFIQSAEQRVGKFTCC